MKRIDLEFRLVTLSSHPSWLQNKLCQVPQQSAFCHVLSPRQSYTVNHIATAYSAAAAAAVTAAAAAAATAATAATAAAAVTAASAAATDVTVAATPSTTSAAAAAVAAAAAAAGITDKLCFVLRESDAQLTPREVQHIERMLIRAGASDVGMPLPTADVADLPEERVRTLHKIVADIQSLGTAVSRLPQFPR